MESVGQILREERLRQGLALEAVSARTRIPTAKLSAIEADQPLQFSSAFFYKSFVRQFAGFLGVDFSGIAPAVHEAAGLFPEPKIPGQGDGAMPKVPALVVVRVRSFRWLYSMASLVAVFVACSTLYAVWRASRAPAEMAASRANRVSRHAAANPGMSARQSHPSEHVATEASSESTIAQGQAPPVAASTEVFKLQVSALEKTWLSIVSDGNRVYSGILQADESKLLEGHESARIKTGNAGGLEVVFNGKQIGPLGAKGQVRTVVFTKDNFEIVPPPVHIALVMLSKPTGE